MFENEEKRIKFGFKVKLKKVVEAAWWGSTKRISEINHTFERFITSLYFMMRHEHVSRFCLEIVILWVAPPCRLADGNWHSGGLCHCRTPGKNVYSTLLPPWALKISTHSLFLLRLFLDQHFQQRPKDAVRVLYGFTSDSAGWSRRNIFNF